MKWIVIAAAAAAVALFGWGRWTRAQGRSPDERAGADILYLAAAALLAGDILLLAGWAAARLLFY